MATLIRRQPDGLGARLFFDPASPPDARFGRHLAALAGVGDHPIGARRSAATTAPNRARRLGHSHDLPTSVITSGGESGFDVPAASRAAHTAIGQYCVIQVGDDEGYFALASSPGAALFEFYLTPGGPAARRLLASPLGAEVSVGTPAGSGFGVEAMLGGGEPLVVLATGSALGAVMGAIRAAKAAGHAVTVYYGSRTPEAVPYRGQLAELGIDLRLVLSGGGGYVQDALATDAPDLSGAWLVACGQRAMQARAKEIGAQLGLPEARFLTNY